MRPGPCEHCGSPDRSRQCRWAWWLPYAADWKKSGADAPCYCDDYDEDMRDLGKRNVAGFSLTAVIIVSFLCWVIFGH